MLHDYAHAVTSILVGGIWLDVAPGTFGVDTVPWTDDGLEGWRADLEDGERICGPVVAIQAIRWRLETG